VTPARWNRVIAAGDSVTFGFIGHRGDALPTIPGDVTLDGVRCAG
jgi:hypothetical protein